MKLHQRAIDLLVNLQDAMSHIERLSEREVRDLFRETEVVLRLLIARDVPQEKE